MVFPRQTGPVPTGSPPPGGGRRQTFSTVTTGSNSSVAELLHISAEFPVRTIRLTNLSSHWLQIPIANAFVISGSTLGVIISLPFPTQEIGIFGASPTGAIIPSTVRQGILAVTAYEDPLLDFPGLPLSALIDASGELLVDVDSFGGNFVHVSPETTDGKAINVGNAPPILWSWGLLLNPTGGLDRVRGSFVADALAATGIPITELLGLNPAGTLDRLRGDATKGLETNPHAADQSATTAGAANAGATLTLPAPGAGLFQYITFLRITRVATAALAGGALLTVTTTNLPGGPAYRVGNNMIAGGTDDLFKNQFAHAIKAAAANTAVTFVAPAAGAAVSWDMEAHWFNAP